MITLFFNYNQYRLYEYRGSNLLNRNEGYFKNNPEAERLKRI